MPSVAYRLSSFEDIHVHRDGEFERTDFAAAEVPGTLCLALTEKYMKTANANPAIACVVTSAELAPLARADLGVAVAVDPQQLFYRLHNEMVLERGMRPSLAEGIDPSARIHPSAVIEDGVSIGRNVVIEAGVIVKRNTVIEDGVLLGTGALIGVEGHYYKRFGEELFRVEHAGGVSIGKGSHVLAGAIVQKALYPNFTQIGRQTVISVGAHIGHGVSVGDDCIIAGSVQIAGYTKVGNGVWIGPSAVVRNLIQIGDNARIEIGAIVAKSVPAGAHYSGPFAMPHTRNLRLMAQWGS